MLEFKLWFENLVKASEKAFEAKNKIKKQEKNLGKILGFQKPLNFFSQGSYALIYEHPLFQDRLIKITTHKDDAYNLYKAQRVVLPYNKNIVKLYGRPQEKFISGVKCWVLDVEKINGPTIPLSGVEILALKNDHPSDAEMSQILARYGKDTIPEHRKLNDLLDTLRKLDRIGIPLSDLTDNILDAGNRYVIVDFGC